MIERVGMYFTVNRTATHIEDCRWSTVRNPSWTYIEISADTSKTIDRSRNDILNKSSLCSLTYFFRSIIHAIENIEWNCTSTISRPYLVHECQLINKGTGSVYAIRNRILQTYANWLFFSRDDRSQHQKSTMERKKKDEQDKSWDLRVRIKSFPELI